MKLRAVRLPREAPWPIMVVLALSFVGHGWAAEMQMLHGHVPSVVTNLNLRPLGRVSATNQLHLAIGLPLRNQELLTNFLEQLYDPARPQYHQYLTKEQFTERFGPTEQDYEAVKDFARTNGLTLTATHGNRLLLDVSAPAAAVERAFHVTLKTYRHPSEARVFFAPDSEPTVDAALPMADVQGLSDYSRPRPRLHRIERSSVAKGRPRNGSSPDGAGAYFGNDFRNAYVPGTALTGAGQMVGLFEFDGFYTNDIATYAAAAKNGRASIPIQTVLVDGVSGTPGYSGISGGNDEVSLDIEMVIAMAPGLAGVVVVEGNLQNDILNAMVASSTTVKTLSCSWGWEGGPSTTTDAIFENMAAVGQSFFDASGDTDAYTAGANSANGADNSSTYNAPASNPYITQVGGTTLTMNGTGASYASETVWNLGLVSGEGVYVGSSGGISSYYSLPSWQTNVSNMAGRGGSTSFRNIPDVALVADDVFIDFGNGDTEEVGGTSCAAPLWAAFVALVNEQAAASGRPAAGFVNPALYMIAAGPNYAACFHDITTGNNTWSGSPNLFYATNGYDLCTGLGTPAGQSLIDVLAPGAGLIISPLSVAAVGPAGGPFTIASGDFVLTNSSGSALTWSLVNTSAWLHVSPTNGTLAAAAQTSVACSLTAAVDSFEVGNYAASLTFSNWTSNVTQAAVFMLQVNQPMVVSPTNGFASVGPVGGPFGTVSQVYTLANQGGSALAWSVIDIPSWLGASPASGVLAGGAQTNMTLSLTAASDSLAYGVYTATVVITNTAGVVANLPFNISVGQPIVVNGGFESGNFNGWTLNGSTRYNVVTTTSGLVHSGSYGAGLGQTPGLGYLYQTLPTVPGQNYLVSLWLDNPSNSRGATPNQFLVQWNGTTLFNQSNIPFISWTNLQFIVAATSTSTVLQFGFEDTPYYLGLDDVNVTPVSVPEFRAVESTSTAFNLAWNAVPGLVYQVQYNTNLAQANWIDLGKPLIATNGTLTLSDTNAVTSAPQRFYRLVELP
jgi:Pro-kumamolisin, activation domain/Viral BACON domain